MLKSIFTIFCLKYYTKIRKKNQEKFFKDHCQKTSLVVFVKNDTFLYGQRVLRSGNLIGPQIQISNNHASETAIAYDGTNWLVTWVY